MRTKFTYGHIMLGLMGLMVLVVVNILLPSAIDCTDNKICQMAFQQMHVIGLAIGTVIIVFGVFIPFFKSIKPQDVRNELAENSGPAHGTLPKGFDNEQRSPKGVES